MFYAISLCFLLGLCNLVIAIYMCEISARHTNPFVFYAWSNLIAGVMLLGLCLYRGVSAESASLLQAGGCMTAAATFYVLSTAAVIEGYKYGDRMLATSCRSICYVFPVVFGILLFHERPGTGGYIGMALLLAGTLLGTYEKRASTGTTPASSRDFHKWFGLLVISIILNGSAAVAQSVPTWLKMSDVPPLLRATLIMLVTSVVNMVMCGFFKTPFWRGLRAIMPWCAVWAVIGALTNLVFFMAVDAMAAQNIGALTFPVYVGIFTIAFSVYARVRFRETFNAATILTVVLCVLGVICVSLRNGFGS